MDQEIIMMLRYPACLGFLNEDELDRAFDTIRGSQIMSDLDCTFGASITACEGPACPLVPLQPTLPRPSSFSPRFGSNRETGPRSRVSTMISKFETWDGENKTAQQQPERATSSVSSSPPTSSSGRASRSEITRGFYLKSAPAAAKQAYPTIVVEMYVNFPANDGFVQDASDSIKSAIECHILSPRAASITRIKFLVSNPWIVYSLPCCNSEEECG